MKAAASLLALVASSVVLAAEFERSANAGISPVHARLHVSHAKARRSAMGKNYKRCKPKHAVTSSAEPAPTSAPVAAPTSSEAPAATTAPASTGGGGGGGGSSGGVINVKTSGCGSIGAVAKTVKDAGPNGAEGWLNCGIEGGGWNPPFIQVHDLKYKNLDDEFANPNSIFKNCKQYRNHIYDASGKYDLLPIMIASIMMQESSCNKETIGGGGEQGLMQITKDKCGGAPGGNCRDPGYNIDTGSRYLAGQIKACGGNVLEAVGTYNGWSKGLTYGKATAAAKTNCCRCQNNLDYPHQFFNGWMQGIDAYSSDLGTYKNLNVCHD
ncbi:hypothetical protein FRC08_012675 [Ceratobasidium sp. 394]|nr:hypothetical protein FRC08_012675 [Ceratobasidium sp. 394]